MAGTYRPRPELVADPSPSGRPPTSGPTRCHDLYWMIAPHGKFALTIGFVDCWRIMQAFGPRWITLVPTSVQSVPYMSGMPLRVTVPAAAWSGEISPSSVKSHEGTPMMIESNAAASAAG